MRAQEIWNFLSSCPRNPITLEPDWLKWYEEHPELFVRVLNLWISKKKIPCPFVSASALELQRDFIKLYNYNPTVLKRIKWEHRFPLPLTKGQGPGPLLHNSRAGNLLSNYFSQEKRAKTRGSYLRSAADTWNDPSFRLRALRNLKMKYSLKKQRIPASILWDLCRNKGARISYFRPSIAKQIYRLFHAKRVYDFSAGWGDRLLAAFATPEVELYVGTDPNSQLQPLYQQIGTFCEHFRHLDWKIETSPAEEIKLPSNFFDLVFTSPPYFSLERYGAGTSDEANQSWSRYSTLDAWLEGFLFPSIEKAVRALKLGGWLVLNLADYQQSGKQIPVASRTVNHLKLNGELEFKTVLGMPLSSRFPKHTLSFAEPIWVWRKEKEKK